MLTETEIAKETQPLESRLTAPQAPSDAMIRTKDLWKTYVMGEEEIHALRGVSFEILRGEYVAIIGPSGSGKSTLMNMIGCLDTPSQGEYWLNGKLVSQMDDDELARIRNKEIGFVFQTFNLLPRATALHNVELPLIYNGTPSAKRIEMAKRALESVDLGSRMNHRPNELSGGQRQRVAIARALAAEPRVLILDESVAALDVSIQAQILNLLADIREETGISYVLISHDLAVVRQITDEAIVMHRGRVVERGPTGEVLDHPQEPYTQLLRASVPRPGWKPTRAVRVPTQGTAP